MFNAIKSWIKSFSKPGIEMSYSRVGAYGFCPWKYKLIYEDRKHVPPNPAISLGQSIHKTLEDFHLKNGSSFDDLMESFDRSWENIGFASPQQVQDYFEKGQRMLENYWAMNKDSKPDILYIEKEFNFSIGKNTLRGIIDRVDRLADGTVEVIDYKTHAELWSNARVEADLQISLYAYACKKALKAEPSILSYYFLAHNKKVSTKRTKEQIERALQTVKDTAEKILKREYTPKTENCIKCDFKYMCEFSTQRKVSKMSS